ncbi:MAG: lipopolysaccharide biosynthesis protein [Gemmataceae bacterium]
MRPSTFPSNPPDAIDSPVSHHSFGKRVNRSARLAATIASSWLRTAVTMAIGLAVTPILIRYLGQERFGVVRAAEQWFAYLEFLNFGLGPAIAVLIVAAASEGTPSQLVGTARSGFALLAHQLRWVLPSAIALTVTFPFALDLSKDLKREFLFAGPILVFSACSYPAGVFRSVLEARQQGYLLNFSLIVQSFVAAALGVGFATIGFGLTGQLWAWILGAVAWTCFCIFFAGGMTRAFWATPAVPIRRTEVWQLQWPLLIAGIGTQFNLLSDNLLAGVTFGVGEAASLFLTQRLFQLAGVVAGSINGSGTWTGLVDLRARVGVAAFRLRVAEVSKLNLGINLLVLAPVLVCNRRFISLWVGDGLYAGDGVTVATFLQLATYNFFCLFSALIDVLGRTRRRVWVSTAGTALKIALIFPFTAWFGLAGLPLATAVAYLATDVWYCPHVLCSDNGFSSWDLLAGTARAVAVGGSWAGLCYYVGTQDVHLLPGWPGLITEAAAFGFGSVLLGWLFLLSESERSLWKVRVRGWFHTRESTER